MEPVVYEYLDRQGNRSEGYATDACERFVLRGAKVMYDIQCDDLQVIHAVGTVVDLIGDVCKISVKDAFRDKYDIPYFLVEVGKVIKLPGKGWLYNQVVNHFTLLSAETMVRSQCSIKGVKILDLS